MAVLQHGGDEQQHAEAGVCAQEEQFAAVVLPICSGQVTRSVVAPLLIQFRRFQPVGSTEGGEKEERAVERESRPTNGSSLRWNENSRKK